LSKPSQHATKISRTFFTVQFPHLGWLPTTRCAKCPLHFPSSLTFLNVVERSQETCFQQTRQTQNFNPNLLGM